jgi:hypothetical protein
MCFAFAHEVEVHMKSSVENLLITVKHDRSELLRSFVAGGAYIAFALGVSAVALKSVTYLAAHTLPDVVASVSPAQFPKYSANGLAKAQRFNQAVVASWEFQTADNR